jgi:hypothetical protein
VLLLLKTRFRFQTTAFHGFPYRTVSLNERSINRLYTNWGGLHGISFCAFSWNSWLIVTLAILLVYTNLYDYSGMRRTITWFEDYRLSMAAGEWRAISCSLDSCREIPHASFGCPFHGPLLVEVRWREIVIGPALPKIIVEELA